MVALRLGLLVLLASAVAPGGGVEALVDENVSALDLALAMVFDPDLVAGASFLQVPPSGTPFGVGSVASADGLFPRHGESYAVLTTGEASLADDPSANLDVGFDLGGGNLDDEDNFDRDGTILQVDLKAPAGSECVVFEFVFLSDEFPYTEPTEYNDAFLAGLDGWEWGTDAGRHNAIFPRANYASFAFAAPGQYVTVNEAGPMATIGAASGTPYHQGLPLRLAQPPISEGPHSVFFTMFDQNDGLVDSAVFIDNLDVVPLGGSCVPGARLPTAVALASASRVSLGEAVAFDGSASFDDPPGMIVSHAWAMDGTSLAFTPAFSAAFDATGTFCAELLVADDDGLLDNDQVCVEVVDELTVSATPSAEVYGALEAARIDVSVAYASGAAVADATVALRVQYSSGDPMLDAVLPRECRVWEASGEADEAGMASFVVPLAFLERCFGGPGVAELPSDLFGGGYSVFASAVMDGNAGSDEAEYSVGIVP